MTPMFVFRNLDDVLDEAKNQLDLADRNRREQFGLVMGYEARKHLPRHQQANVERSVRDMGGIAFLRERVQFHAGEVEMAKRLIGYLEAARRERDLRGLPE